MLRIVLLSALVAAALAATPALAGRNNGESIPPNCTLDPFTHKLVCHIWPTCTMDPFTGKMNCPVPKARLDRQPD
ncbi:MAG: hypothetical protein J0I99_13665 [Devosia sp.]|uniref:hypothetical protein n=1 Tax=Devosia sp. TaxID=1871048 RepID=UPI001ACFFB59|nr:hypothetical protein [Devosia sp.]MBN9311390.1 hypothetical protein [Devosia sp.]MBN9316784.1 hypothetical protein [Devosia sp.]